MSCAPGNAWVSASTLERGPSGASSSACTSPTSASSSTAGAEPSLAPPASAREPPRVRVDHEREATAAAEVRTERRLDLAPLLLALAPHDLAADGERGGIAVDHGEATVGEATSDDRLETTVDLRPGGDELVEGDGRAGVASTRLADATGAGSGARRWCRWRWMEQTRWGLGGRGRLVGRRGRRAWCGRGACGGSLALGDGRAAEAARARPGGPAALGLQRRPGRRQPRWARPPRSTAAGRRRPGRRAGGGGSRAALSAAGDAGRDGSRSSTPGERALEAVDALGEGGDRAVRRRLGDLDQGDLEGDAGVGRLAHLQQRVADQLERPGGGSVAEPVRPGADPRLLGVGQMVDAGPHAQEEHVAEPGEQRLAEDARVAAGADPVGDRGERGAGVGCDDGVEQRIDRLVALQHTAGRDDLIEGRQGVASRAAALAEDVVDGLLVDVEAGVVGDPCHVLGEDLRRDQVELVVLGPAADRRQDLVRIGRGEHEHDVTGGLLERLQQRVRRRRRQHVDLVEDVHLRAPGRARGPPCR